MTFRGLSSKKAPLLLDAVPEHWHSVDVMLKDRYGFALSTSSAAARDAYIAGVDLFLSANQGDEEQFRRAIAIDDGFAVAHAALARSLQAQNKPVEARSMAARARELAATVPHRERSHVIALATVVDSGSVAGLAALKEHLVTYPRDAMVLAPCTGVFGLIGFSGRAGREAELLALLDPLAAVYGNDWWFTSVYAFAQVETGDTDRALATIERSLALYPRNANGAHVRSHAFYESGERTAGLAYLEGWWRDYPKASRLHCHLSWHVAIWRMELGRRSEAWDFYRNQIQPGASIGIPILTLTDSASFLFRAEIAGEPRDPALWREVSLYATRWFPSPGTAFADVHGALAHAFAGDSEALAKIIDGASGPAADVVAPISRAFGAFNRSDWNGAASELQTIMATHERIGGSRAQRDLIEYALVVSQLRAGRIEEARRLLETRRLAGKTSSWPIQGL